MLNPNLVLGGIIAVLLIGTGAFIAVFLAGGTDQAVLARVGLITAFLAGPLTSLIAVLNSNQARIRADAQHVEMTEVMNGHTRQNDEDREAMEARIAYLENLDKQGKGQ